MRWPWYVDLDGDGFVEHEVTDIALYDTEDTSGLVWFTVPKATGKGVWLPPYVTDNLDVRVISYNAPVYCGGGSSASSASRSTIPRWRRW